MLQSDSKDIMFTTILLFLLCIASIGFGVYTYIQFTKLRTRLDSALGGQSGDSIERTLAKQHTLTQSVSDRLTELNREYQNLIATTSVASQKISIVRYNPFGDTGGDQSFSLAVLDAHDSGYVLTSIHGRQGTRVYLKPIDFGKSKHSLSTEEEQAITRAMARIPQVPDQPAKLSITKED